MRRSAGGLSAKDPIGLAGGVYLYAYAPNPLSYIDPLGLSAISGIDTNNVFRGDGNFSGGSIGLPREGIISAEDIVSHIEEKGDGRLTSFSTKNKSSPSSRGADLFSNKVFKVSVADLAELEKAGYISVLTQENVKGILKSSSGKSIRRNLNNILQNMSRNNEVLVHGQIHGDTC